MNEWEISEIFICGICALCVLPRSYDTAYMHVSHGYIEGANIRFVIGFSFQQQKCGVESKVWRCGISSSCWTSNEMKCTRFRLWQSRIRWEQPKLCNTHGREWNTLQYKQISAVRKSEHEDFARVFWGQLTTLVLTFVDIKNTFLSRMFAVQHLPNFTLWLMIIA